MIIKTAVQQQWNIVEPKPPHFIVYDQATVDDATWYTVRCSKEASAWVRMQQQDQWYEHPYEQITRYNFHEPKLGKFDVHCELFVLLKLSWS